MIHLRLAILWIATVVVHLACASRVLELSDKFVEISKDGHWLVKFYAPWCGHCKRLEPIWGQVAQALHKTNIRVGRVDCTRFPSVAAAFSVGAYPTIKFIKPDQQFLFRGDRTKDELVNFAIRMSGPPVQQVTHSNSFVELERLSKIFFMYVGDQEGSLWEAYNDVASKLQTHTFFYAVDHEVAAPHVKVERPPAVFVHKEGLRYFYELDNGVDVSDELEDIEHLNTSVYKWINEERFATFPKVTRGNLHEIVQTGKYIVLVVVEENKLEQLTKEMTEFKDMIELTVLKGRDKYHKYFQFGWVGSPELANSIAMQILPLPHLIVLNSTTNHHHLPEDDIAQLTPKAVDLFLESIYNQSVPAYGGNSWPVRFYRTYFEARTSLAEMWRGNPVLTTVIFGLPLGFLSLILYSICCADIMDADEDDNQHEKKE